MRIAPFPLAFVLALTGPALAQSAFEACGTVVSSGPCARLFQPDGTTGHIVLVNWGSFQVGDRVHVTGTLRSCETACLTGSCILDNTIESCAPCNCVPYCFGVDPAVACPCGNTGRPGFGCGNSADAMGAQLLVWGGTSVSDDDTVLVGWRMPSSAALYIQGTGAVEAVFGDGKRCAGGTVTRLATKTNVNGASKYPEVGEPRLATLAGITGPATRYYQVWYRDPAAFCTSATHNLTNGVRVDWAL